MKMQADAQQKPKIKMRFSTGWPVTLLPVFDAKGNEARKATRREKQRGELHLFCAA